MNKQEQRARLRESFEVGEQTAPLHYHVWLRNFFSGTESDRGHFASVEEAVSAASEIVRQAVRIQITRAPGQEIVLEVNSSATARVRSCQEGDCLSLANRLARHD